MSRVVFWKKLDLCQRAFKFCQQQLFTHVWWQVLILRFANDKNVVPLSTVCHSSVLSKHKPQFQETLNEMGAPFINDRTHPPHSTATPTFFLQCVTWFPCIAINDLTEQVLLPAMRKELKSDLKQLCFLPLLWRVTSYSYVTAASMPLIVAIVQYGSLVYWSNIYSRTGQRETAHRENTLNTSGFSNIYQQFALTENFKSYYNFF